jgi:hypothetical protein
VAGLRLWLLALCLAVWPHTRAGAAHDALLEWQGRQLAVDFSDEIGDAARAELLQWIEFVAGSLGQVYGRWPRELQHIAIAPASSPGDDPIPWAEVRRGEVDRVEFFVAAGASAERLRQAWTGYHELAHLLIPYRGWGDAWFSEGLASYYQNLMQARAGVLTENEMWQRLYDGFRRGLAEREFDGRPLRSVSDNLRRDGGYMRVYWSGAWYFLAADTRLRLQSRGHQTLDGALERLNRCCAERSMSVPEMVDRLDELNRLVLFRPLYDELVESTRIPPFATLFASLGIALEDGRVTLQSVGPGAAIRRQMVYAAPGVDARPRGEASGSPTFYP